MLAAVQTLDFASIRDQLGVADSVVSKHLARLQALGYVTIVKVGGSGYIRTQVSLTKAGRRAFAGHIAALRLIAGAAGLDG